MVDKLVTKSSPVSKERTYTILLVEDDQVLQKMYAQKLASQGYRVLAAGDGQEAYELFENEDIDLVITDIMLPRVSGTEFLRKIKTTTKGKDIPVVAWSNLAYEEEKKQALESGADEYIVKGTLTLDQIVNTVKKYLK